MKQLLFFAVFLLVLVSCKKEGETPSHDLVFGNCLQYEEPVTLSDCDRLRIDNNPDYCKEIHQGVIFPLSETAGDWLPYFCLEKEDSISFVNSDNEFVHISIVDKIRKRVFIDYTSEICENDSSRTRFYCSVREAIYIRIQSPLSEQRLMLNFTPYMEINGTSIQELPESLRIYNLLPASVTGVRRSLSIPFNWENNSQPLPYDYQYLPEIEILGKTFFEVYTHKEDLNGFYTKIYYNKEFGIVSFVDETGVQWRVDL